MGRLDIMLKEAGSRGRFFEMEKIVLCDMAKILPVF